MISLVPSESNGPESTFTPECRLVDESRRYARKAVRDIRFDGDLTIAIQGPGFSYAHVVFREPIGFRVMDEAALIEYWNTYSEPQGWLWEVVRGGWLDLERQRPAFWQGREVGWFREYFLVDEHCVNVIAVEPPEIIDLGRDPSV
ncbi:hypothetical protein NONO_c65080 [Nocardia nova SH22a]|uniref:Uncharacterized protein n=2 Tax=Nocardia nova TaxID=37330 RepID=W5TQP5_9NOCA|nr:hypothetical protein NONO_c65080 [Nocardia nova SH22a]